MSQRSFLTVFVGVWALTIAVLLPFYEPQILGDYLRLAVMGAFGGVIVLVVLVGVLHQRAYYHRQRPMMSPVLVWGMGSSYLLAAGTVAVALYGRVGEALSYRSVALALSLGLALCWLIPLAKHLKS